MPNMPHENGSAAGFTPGDDRARAALRPGLRARVVALDAAANAAKAREAEALEQLHAAQAEAATLQERVAALEAQAAEPPAADALRARIVQLERTIAEARAGEAEALEQLHAAAAGRGEVEAARVEAAALQRRRATLEEPAPAGEAESVATRHLVFAVVGPAYHLVELDGPPPAPGDLVELESGRHLVVRVGASPLAGSRLPCAYTIRNP